MCEVCLVTPRLELTMRCGSRASMGIACCFISRCLLGSLYPFCSVSSGRRQACYSFLTPKIHTLFYIISCF